MSTTHKLVEVKDLKAGDAVDLEGDCHADPNRDKPLLANEYQVVDELTVETEACTLVSFENFSCGFPPNHKVRVRT